MRNKLGPQWYRKFKVVVHDCKTPLDHEKLAIRNQDLRDFVQGPIAVGIFVVVSTNVPCHWAVAFLEKDVWEPWILDGMYLDQMWHMAIAATSEILEGLQLPVVPAKAAKVQKQTNDWCCGHLAIIHVGLVVDAVLVALWPCDMDGDFGAVNIPTLCKRLTAAACEMGLPGSSKP